MLRTSDLDYHLPEELIATSPASPRDSARLLVVSRSNPDRVEHRTVRDLPEILRPRDKRSTMPQDLMVVNATRVLPARFLGVRTDTGGHAEGLYVEPAPRTHPLAAKGPLWIVLLKLRRMKPDVLIALHDRHGRDSGVRLRLIERSTGESGGWIVLVESSTLTLTPGMTAADLLEWVGLTPIPPYILAARRKTHEAIADERDRSTYQTVYATDKHERAGHGSVAAPTAGLHFTPALLDQLRDAGIQRAEVTLDVGLGTFKPIESEFVEQHPMHGEWCYVPPETALAVARAHPSNATPDSRGRVIAIGTTSARTLESFASVEEMLQTKAKDTRLLITPGYTWKHVDVLMTNFHLPQSTLLAMVAALFVRDGEPADLGVQRLRKIYETAVNDRYRFYSYGDAMLILP